jgi:hypothetical protein
VTGPEAFGHNELAPGDTCGACGRRKPFPRKDSTPKSRPKAYRVPEDEREAHEEVLEQAAKHLGAHERPFWEFWVYTYALAAVLQDANLKGAAQRQAA